MGAHQNTFDPTRPAFGHAQPQQPAYQPPMHPALQASGHPAMQHPHWAPQAYAHPQQFQPMPDHYAHYPQAMQPFYGYGQPQQAWAPPQPGYFYGQPMPQGYAPVYPQAEPEVRQLRETLERRREISTVEEIRDSLREVREAIRELADTRRASRLDYDRVD